MAMFCYKATEVKRLEVPKYRGRKKRDRGWETGILWKHALGIADPQQPPLAPDKL